MINNMKYLYFAKSALMTALLWLAVLPTAYSTESGTSHYMPGAYNDFFYERSG
jgi:hypothetical protein